jgi:hypothetical protein
MHTHISAAALLDSTTITAGYVTVLALVLVLAPVMFGLRFYRNRQLRNRGGAEFSAELSEAVWPSVEFPESNARLASVLRSTKTNELAAIITAELDRRDEPRDAR